MALCTKEDILTALKEVKDPEIPSVDIVGMGLISDVIIDDGKIQVCFMPTYSGCPALEVIENNIREVLSKKFNLDIEVKRVLSPLWSTDLIDDITKEKLKQAGIAPPCKQQNSEYIFIKKKNIIVCPYCNNSNTEVRSEFGSTACKALCYCYSCQQPFEYFKEY